MMTATATIAQRSAAPTPCQRGARYEFLNDGAHGMRVVVYDRKMAEDRRAAPRQEAYLSAALETAQGKSAIAITRDISSTGLLILVGARLVVGETIKLTVVIDEAQRSLSARVVRQERLEPHELWRYKVALAVDGADPVLAQVQSSLAAQAQAQASEAV